ncbi:hypothetical protein HCY76_07680 [Limosilactobacillus fermentum]|uniref:hypothetical protein n=1 Tax=Limosilactobacillus fermentum TaxID=1613 RepID=UPI00187DEF14|nr:hypothetical protein [Limosilactobacillus fermentum]MBE8118010.1 hypothetical protein [Limosilactobacillus fermentum]
MRMSHHLDFYSEAAKKYNPKTSKYEGGSALVDQVWGNVTDMGLTRSVEVFGNYAQKAVVVRLMRPVVGSWSYMTIDGGATRYRLQTAREVSKGTTLIVGSD